MTARAAPPAPGRLCGGNAFYARHSWQACLEAQQRLGVENIELWPLAAHLWVDQHGHQPAAPLAADLAAAGIRPVLLLPALYQYSLSAAPGTAWQRATYDYYGHCLEVAAGLGIPYLCVDARGGCLDDGRDTLLGRVTEAAAALAEEAAGHGLRLLVQTAPPWVAPVLNTLPELQQVLKACGGQAGAALDTAAVYSAGEEIGEWFTALGERIEHVRLLDGRNAGYRVWGQGVWPLGPTLAALEAGGYKGLLGTQALTDRYDADPPAAEQAGRARIEKGRVAV